ncbi:MAG: hypothetical protein K2R98_03720 [Gemmataceae bacterium]|nr:hypothetical protein [Gemmataceae bacterium]
MAVCRYHPDRAAIGVCMRCRAVICAECCTRMDGVNHCHACLRTLGRRGEVQRGDNVMPNIAGTAVFGVAWLVLFGLAWWMQGWLAP